MSNEAALDLYGSDEEVSHRGSKDIANGDTNDRGRNNSNADDERLLGPVFVPPLLLFHSIVLLIYFQMSILQEEEDKMHPEAAMLQLCSAW
jgi:hypothetical protein